MRMGSWEETALQGSGGSGNVGMWLVGARGSVGTTAICGLLAMQRQAVPPIGSVTEGMSFGAADVPEWNDIAIGGHDVVDTPLRKRAEQLAAAGSLPGRLVPLIADDLSEVDEDIPIGCTSGRSTQPQEDTVRRLAADISRFRDRRGLARVVVVNVAATEAPLSPEPGHEDLAALRDALATPGRAVLPPSSLYAYAALSAGCSYVDFTPSPGIRLPALEQYARQRTLPYAGSDGKTGQTLLRTVLAPMFTARALAVRSWSGTNLLGGGDGATLAESDRASAKLASKSRGLGALLGPDVTAPLHIDNVPELGDRKVAWDHVQFEGFLGAEMSLQLTWSGYDSALAAPLVLDLTRLLAGAHAAGLSGPVAELACFFKDPVEGEEHGFADQVRTFERWVAELGADA